MSSRKCKACGDFFSIKLSACPACGKPYEQEHPPLPKTAPAYHEPFQSRPAWNGPTEYGKQKAREIRELMKSFTAKTPDKSWAKRLLDRHRAGEPIDRAAVEMALEVTGDAPAPYQTRTPGEDDA